AELHLPTVTMVPVEEPWPPIGTAIVTVKAWHTPGSSKVQPNARRRVRRIGIGVWIHIGWRHGRRRHGRLRKLLLKLRRSRGLAVYLALQLSDHLLLSVQLALKLSNLLLLTLDEGVQTAGLRLVRVV